MRAHDSSPSSSSASLTASLKRTRPVFCPWWWLDTAPRDRGANQGIAVPSASESIQLSLTSNPPFLKLLLPTLSCALFLCILHTGKAQDIFDQNLIDGTREWSARYHGDSTNLADPSSTLQFQPPGSEDGSQLTLKVVGDGGPDTWLSSYSENQGREKESPSALVRVRMIYRVLDSKQTILQPLSMSISLANPFSAGKPVFASGAKKVSTEGEWETIEIPISDFKVYLDGNEAAVPLGEVEFNRIGMQLEGLHSTDYDFSFELKSVELLTQQCCMPQALKYSLREKYVTVH